MTAPRTVLHLIDTGGPGGAETIFTQVALGLDADRWRSLLLVPVRDWLMATLERAGAAPRLLGTSRSFDVAYLATLVRLMRRERVRLVHAHLFASGVYGSLAGRLAGVPVVCTLHGRVDIEDDDRLRGAKLRILDRRRNRVVFVSDSLRRWYAGAAPLRRAGQAVVLNGIDLRAFAPGRDRPLRRELGMADDELLVGAVGNIRPAKDYGTLLRAAARVRASGARVRFVIVGEGSGELHRRLLEERAALGLEDTVALPGFREDVPAVLRSLDIYVSSSSSEGFSLTTVQALASELPVLATRCGGPEEILEDGRTGLLVPPAEPAALAQALLRLAGDGALRRALARAGRAVAESRFAMERMVADYEAVYADALGLAAGPGLTRPAAPRLVGAPAPGRILARQEERWRASS